MAGFSLNRRSGSRFGRICACLGLVAASAVGQGGSPCSEPQDGYVPLAAPGGPGGVAITFTGMKPNIPNTCAPQVFVFPYEDEVDIVKIYPCTGVVITQTGIPLKSLGMQLTTLCGTPWVQQNYPSTLKSSLRLASAASSQLSNQGSQNAIVADLNGDGNPDIVLISSLGVKVQLLAADGSVLSSRNYPVGFTTSTYGDRIIAADFNGDGNIDLAVSNFGTGSASPGTVAILLGNGDGTFGSPTGFPAGLNPVTLAAADFNGDGNLDLAVGNYSSGDPSGFGPGTVSLLLGNGDGTFAVPVTYATGEDMLGFPNSLLALDLNGDGLPDLAIANRNDKSITVLLNAGGGQFQSPLINTLPYGGEFLAVSDFNHDGNPDLAAVSMQSNALMMLFGNGDGTFQAAIPYVTGNSPQSIGVVPLDDGNTVLFTADSITGNTWFTAVSPDGTINLPRLNSVGGSPGGIAVADLNGDGQPDVVVAGAHDDVDVLLSQNGQFGVPTGYSLGPNSPRPATVATADLNNDGKPDVVTVNGSGSISVLLGKGDGTLGTPITTTVDSNARSLAFGDFNGDGNLDVAVAAYGLDFTADNGSITVLKGNGDGTFGTAQTLTISGLHPVAVAAADLNGDGILDLAAVAIVGSSVAPATLAVFLGQPGGTFQPAVTFPLQTTGGPKSGIAIGDLNGDGIPDIVAFSNGIASFGNSGQKIDVMLGDGTGAFHETPAVPTTAATQGGGLTLVDVNGDGILDIVTCGSLFLGNGDGTAQSEQQFISGFAPNAVSVTTFNGSPLLVTADQAGTIVATVLPVPGAVSADVSRAKVRVR
jgi:hypothetical protein